MTIKDKYIESWDYIYGGKSHMNLAGKLLIGIPFFPAIFVIVSAFILLDSLFSKAKEVKKLKQSDLVVGLSLTKKLNEHEVAIKFSDGSSFVFACQFKIDGSMLITGDIGGAG